MKKRWTVHLWVLLALALLLVGAGIILWFHPQWGYVQGGILNGADVRSSLIQILGWLFLVFVVSSTAMLKVLALVRRDTLAYLVAYIVGIIAACMSMPIIDKYY